MDGLLVVKKPAGWTSHDVVAKVRGLLKEKRIGHLGTLDPLATGVLPLAVGTATRLVEFASFDKEYLAACRLGRSTDSFDVTGKTLAEKPVGSLSPDRVRSELSALKETVEQVPPMVSAVKKDGRKLYELARRGITVERKARPIRILELEWIGLESSLLRFRVVCSAGTYVRVLCQDLGERLGVGGCLEELERTRVGPFRREEALTLEAIGEKASAGTLALEPSSRLVEHLPLIRLEDAQVAVLEQGRSLPKEEAGPSQGGLLQARNSSNRLCAIVDKTPEGGLKPRKVFVQGGIE